MAIQDTDLFLVNRTGASYKVEAQNLDDMLQDDDLIIVNRSGASYKATGAELRDDTVADSDLMIVNRSGQSYKVTAAEVKELLAGDAPLETAVAGDLYYVNVTTKVVTKGSFPGNEKVINYATTYDSTIAVGTSGRVFDRKALTAGGFGLNSNRAFAGTNNKAVLAGYNSTYSPLTPDTNCYVLKSDDEVIWTTNSSDTPADRSSLFGADKVVAVCSSMAQNVFSYVTDTGYVKCIDYNRFSDHRAFNQAGFTDAKMTEVYNPTAYSNIKAIDVMDVGGVRSYILQENGTLLTCTNTSPLVPDVTNVAKIGPAKLDNSSIAHISGLTTNGDFFVKSPGQSARVIQSGIAGDAQPIEPAYMVRGTEMRGIVLCKDFQYRFINLATASMEELVPIPVSYIQRKSGATLKANNPTSVNVCLIIPDTTTTRR